MISTRKFAGLIVDGAQVYTHSGPPGFFCHHGSDRSAWGQGKDSVYPDEGTELLRIYTVCGWEGRAGGCRAQWAVRRLTIIGHGEDGDLSNGSAAAHHTACPLVDGGQVCVHVSREPSAPGHLLSGS